MVGERELPLGVPSRSTCSAASPSAFLVELAESHGLLGASSRLFLIVGVLGGFTTFSAFGNETMNLLRAAERGLALANATLHLVLAIGAVWAGRALVKLVWR